VEKLSLSEKVKKVSGKQLGQIIRIVRKQCPRAFKDAGDEKF
jgi:hypothetical protein